jgi:hypothetical protein
MPYKDPEKRKAYRNAYMKVWRKTSKKYKAYREVLEKDPKYLEKRRECAQLRKQNPEYYRKHKEDGRRRYVHAKFGITLEEYDRLREESGNRCAICGSLTARPHLDHDHQDGKIREFLCYRCNSGLGYFCDDPLVLEAAVNYLRKHDK